RRPTGPGPGAGTSTQAPRPPGRTPTRPPSKIRTGDDEPRPEPIEARASDFSPGEFEDREPSVSSTGALPRTPSLKGVKRTPTRERRAEERAPAPEDPDER